MFHKIDVNYFAYAEVYQGEMFIYFVNTGLPHIDENSKFIIAGKEYNFTKDQIEDMIRYINDDDYDTLTQENDDYKENDNYINAKDLLYYIDAGKTNLPDDYYSVKVISEKKCLFDYLINNAK